MRRVLGVLILALSLVIAGCTEQSSTGTQRQSSSSEPRNMVRATVVLEDPDYFAVQNESCHGIESLSVIKSGGEVRLHESPTRYSEGTLRGGTVNATGECEFTFELEHRSSHALEFHFGPSDDSRWFECPENRMVKDGDNWKTAIRFKHYGWCEQP